VYALFLERVYQPKKSSVELGNALYDALLMSSFHDFTAGAAKEIDHECSATALCAVLMNSIITELIWAKDSEKFLYFTTPPLALQLFLDSPVLFLCTKKAIYLSKK